MSESEIFTVEGSIEDYGIKLHKNKRFIRTKTFDANGTKYLEECGSNCWCLKEKTMDELDKMEKEINKK